MKCLVKNCSNSDYQGDGRAVLVQSETGAAEFRWLCMPCWEFIVAGEGKFSQVVRNAEDLLKTCRSLT